MKLAELVRDGAVVTPLAARDRDGAVAELIDGLVRAGAAAGAVRDDLIAQVLEREQRGSTGFGKGVAVPHVKHQSVTRMAAAVGLSPTGVDFNALDKQPVYSIFLLLSPVDRPDDHLHAMEVIFKNLSKDTFRRFLRQADTEQEVRSLMEEADAQLLGG